MQTLIVVVLGGPSTGKKSLIAKMAAECAEKGNMERVVDGVTVGLDLRLTMETCFPLVPSIAFPDADVYLICAPQGRENVVSIRSVYLPAIRHRSEAPIMLVSREDPSMISSHMLSLIDIAREERLAGVASTCSLSYRQDGFKSFFEHTVRLGLKHRRGAPPQRIERFHFSTIFKLVRRRPLGSPKHTNDEPLPFYMGDAISFDRTFTCAICLEDGFRYSDMRMWSHSAACQHRFCQMCAKTHITTQVEEGKTVIQCPNVCGGRCNTPLKTATIEHLCGAEVMNTYSRNLYANYFDYVTQLQNEAAAGKNTDFIVWAHHNTRNCPRCAVIIYRFDGCDHMKCRCGTFFDWKLSSRLELPPSVKQDSKCLAAESMVH